MKIFFDRVIYFAHFVDDNGATIGSKRLDEFKPTFSFQFREYILDLTCPSFIKLPIYYGPVFAGYEKYFVYNINHSEPLRFIKNYKPLITPEQYYVQVHTKKLTELNELGKEGGFLEFLISLLKSPIFWIIFVLFIGLILWMWSRGWKLW